MLSEIIMTYIPIKNWADDEKPREKLLKKGIDTLSNAELLAIIIGTGTRELSAVELARNILQMADNNLHNLGRLSVFELSKIKGIGTAKAVSLIAAMEIGRRRNMSEHKENNSITSSRDIYNYMSPRLRDLPYEEFWVCYLNRANYLIESFKISQGGVTGTVIDTKIILKKGLELLASSVILCHNHPSGNVAPSNQDKEITLRTKNAAETIEIKVLDHIIVARDKYFSFSDEGLI